MDRKLLALHLNTFTDVLGIAKEAGQQMSYSDVENLKSLLDSMRSPCTVGDLEPQQFFSSYKFDELMLLVENPFNSNDNMVTAFNVTLNALQRIKKDEVVNTCSIKCSNSASTLAAKIDENVRYTLCTFNDVPQNRYFIHVETNPTKYTLYFKLSGAYTDYNAVNLTSANVSTVIDRSIPVLLLDDVILNWTDHIHGWSQPNEQFDFDDKEETKEDA